MNRSVKNLLSVSVLAPVAALAVAAAPANAAPGPATTLLYESYAAAAPVAQALPEPLTGPAWRTAELTTLAVDGVLQTGPAGAARCTLNPGKAVNSGVGTGLPDTPLTAAGRTPLGALPEGDCLASVPHVGHRSATGALPAPPGAAGDLPGTGSTGDLPGRSLGPLGELGAVLNGKLGGLPASADAVPGGRHGEAPLSAPLTDIPSTLGAAAPAGLPVGTVLFPPAGRYAQPDPAGDVLGQANNAVNEAGAGLDETGNGVDQVVEVLKARDRARGPQDGPVSPLNPSGLIPSGLGAPGAPGLG